MADTAKRTIVISQPMYFPWPGFLEQMALADIFIWLDDAQFSKGSFTNRIQVNLNGSRKWMTLRLLGKGTNCLIGDLQSSDEKWRNAHYELLRQCFKTSPFRKEALELFNQATSHDRLIDCIIASAEYLARETSTLPTTIMRSSQMNVPGNSWQRVLDLVEHVGGTRYVTGHGAAGYLDHEAFEARGIDVDYMCYSLTQWPQANEPFTPYVTSLDLIAATGPEARNFIHPQTTGWKNFIASRQAGK